MIFYCLHHHNHNIFVEYFTPFKQLSLKLKGLPSRNSLRVKEIFNDGIFVEKKLTGGVKFLCPRSEHSSARVSIRGKKVSRQTEKQKEEEDDEVLKSVLFLFKGRSEIFLTNGQPNLFQNLTKRIASHSSKKSTII